MQLHRILLTSATVAASMSFATAALDTNGGWGAMEIGAEETQLLTKALADDAFYAESVKTRVCFVEIESLGKQVVSGVKYKYQVKACTTATGKSGAGKCAGENANCKAEPMAIVVFDQPWTETLQIVSIDKGASSNSSNGTASNSQDEAAKNGASTDGSAGGKELTAVKNDGSSGSVADAVPSTTTEKPATTTTKAPAPSSAVPTPKPTSSAATASTATLAAFGVAVLAQVL